MASSTIAIVLDSENIVAEDNRLTLITVPHGNDTKHSSNASLVQQTIRSPKEIEGVSANPGCYP